MKFTLSWLKDHLDTDAPLDQIIETLTALGLEVESVEDRAALYAPFSVAYVEDARPHPDADRLQVCTVKSKDGTHQVVCGAPNARAGMKGVFAPVGSHIPGLDLTLKKAKIRGVESEGMLVSEKEMLLSDEHKGIIEVDDALEIGTPMAGIFGLDDAVIDIAITPNRADCAGVRGIARDLAAAGLGTLKALDVPQNKGAFASPINVAIDNKEACPHFIGRYFKNVRNGPSPEWLQNRLKAVGLRPISALVDITNYISYDLCRPLHVFDADKLSGNLRVRLAKEGEEMAALDEKTYKIEDFMTVIADDNGPHALGGVMGGEDSGCTDETVNVFLEVAYFDPMRTAKTGRALQINSDARYRFERGIDPAFTKDGAEIATKMILDLCGGEASEIVETRDAPDLVKSFSYQPSDTQRLTGIAVDDTRQKSIFAALGFEITSQQNDKWDVRRPSWRQDIEGRADLVEEVIRVTGYDNVTATSLPPLKTVHSAAETPKYALARKARLALASRGLQETVTYAFIGKEIANDFLRDGEKLPDSLTLRNPISSEWDQMRPNLLPNLLGAALRNKDKIQTDSALFEVGPAYGGNRPQDQASVAAALRCGALGNKHWSGKDVSRAYDLYDAKADALAALEAVGAPTDNLQITRDAPGYYHPGRSGALRLGKNVLACFGELHPAILTQHANGLHMVACEVFLDNVPASKGRKQSLPDMPELQAVGRDFSFVMPKNIEAAQIERAIRKADKELISHIAVFDIYEGEGLGPDEKSLAISIMLQPRDQSLTEKDIETVSQKIIDTVTKETGARLRA